MKTILISAGHNLGTDSGAVGQGQYEVNDSVRMADRVVLYLKAWGIPCIYMPNNVGDLQAEINWANANLSEGQGYAIQIHRNAGGGTGNEVWTTDYLNQIPLATSILNAMTEITKLRSRGVKDIKTSNWPLGWINYVNAESVLIEARFIDVDSITDADDMLDAYAIACGIADFLGVKRGISLETPKPIITTKEITEVLPIPFKTVTKEDNKLQKGLGYTVVGKNGTITRVYTLTYSDGIETKKVLKSETRVEPVTEEIIVGTYELPVEPVKPVTEPVVTPQPKSWLLVLTEAIVKLIQIILGKDK